jgi:hypothetical protein
MSQVLSKNPQNAGFSAAFKNSLLTAMGNRLCMAYGNISSEKYVLDQFELIFQWLEGGKNRRVDLTVGIPGNYVNEDDGQCTFVPDSTDYAKIIGHIDKIFTPTLDARNISDRIWVGGIFDFNSNVSIMVNEENGSSPTAAIVGSSCFTEHAHQSKTSFEMDLLLDENDPLLQDVFDELENQLDNFSAHYDQNLTRHVRERIFEEPAMEEALRDREVEEQAKLSDDPRMQEAFIESGQRQGISGNK